MLLDNTEAMSLAKTWGYNKLTALQELTFENCSIGEGAREFIIGSTSSGKTLIPLLCYKADRNRAERKNKMIYIVPYRALAAQKEKELKEKFPEERVIVSTSEYCTEDNSVKCADCDIAIVIYEKIYMFLSNDKKFFDNYSHIVFDEIGIVNNSERGLKADFILAGACKNKSSNVYVLATPYYNWKCYIETYSFVVHKELSRPVKIKNKVIRYRVGSKGHETDELNDIVFRLCEKHRKLGHKILIFANSRTRVQDLSRSIHKCFGDEKKNIEDVKKKFFEDIIMTEDDLYGIFNNEDFYAYENGVSYHNAALPEEIREKIERDFLYDDGKLDIVVATETLAYGLNSDVDVVIVAEMEKPAGKGVKQFLTVNEYQNYMGRTGRLGKKDVGYIYTLLTDKQEEAWKNLCEKSQHPDFIESQYKGIFKREDCVFHLLNYFDFDNGVEKDVVLKNIEDYPGNIICKNSRIIDKHIEDLIKRSLIKKVYEELDDRELFYITNKGKRALGFIVYLSTYDKLVKNVDQLYHSQNIQIIDFLYNVCQCDELSFNDFFEMKEGTVYTKQAFEWLRVMKSDGKLSSACFKTIIENKSINKFKKISFNQRMNKQDFETLRKLRMTQALFMWMECYSTEEIKNICGFEYGNIKKLGEKAKYITDILSAEVSMSEKMVELESRLKRIGLSLFYGIRMDIIEKLNVFELDPIDGRQLRTIGRIINMIESQRKNETLKMVKMLEHISAFPDEYKLLVGERIIHDR